MKLTGTHFTTITPHINPLNIVSRHVFVRIIILRTRIVVRTVPQAKVVSSSANQHPYPGSLDSTGDGGEGRGGEGVTMVRGGGRGGGGVGEGGGGGGRAGRLGRRMRRKESLVSVL